MVCQQCGRTNPPGAAYCNGCGMALRAGPARARAEPRSIAFIVGVSVATLLVLLAGGVALTWFVAGPSFLGARNKAASGEHDVNIDFDSVITLVGRAKAEQIRDVSIRIYQYAVEHAARRGIIIADTKFEFGLDEDENLVLMDEVLTPDSSRFWPRESYQPGMSPPSYDKQFVRDYLETLDWDKTPPGPRLPQEVIDATGDKYREVCDLLIDE